MFQIRLLLPTVSNNIFSNLPKTSLAQHPQCWLQDKQVSQFQQDMLTVFFTRLTHHAKRSILRGQEHARTLGESHTRQVAKRAVVPSLAIVAQISEKKSLV